MNDRTLGRTGIRVSEIGLGCEHLQGQDEAAIRAVVDAALENGINILDVFMSEPEVRTNIGKALAGRREQVVLQGHIGAAWLDGQYCRTRDPGQCQFFFEDFMERMQTDYVDVGMLHFVDTMADYESVFNTDVIRYAVELKEKGVIRALGMSSHDPVAACRAVETGLIDVLMFSMNPAFDILPEDTQIDGLFDPASFQKEGLAGVNPAREKLYQTCEAMGTAITVMKTYAGGALLGAESSPFGVAMTPEQCIHYALTRPAVASVMIGCRTPEEIPAALRYESASDAERDYSVVLSNTAKYSLRGKCMYCNHCLPCPSQIDIAQVNKYLDLAALRDEVPATVREHYLALEAHASDCIACGSCEGNCPFGVPVIERMAKARELFGE